MTTAKYSLSIESVTVDTSVANSTAISYGDFEKGMVSIPAGSGLTTLTWHASGSEGGTYLPAQNASGAAITQTVSASKVYPIPSDLFGARFLKITGNAAGVVGVTLKD
jgi:hypothetical protein